MFMLILFNPDSNEPVLPGTLPIFGLVSLLQLYFIYTFSGATTAGLVVTGIATTGSLVTVGKAGPTAA